MYRRTSQAIRILKTTLVGGIFFLLPLGVFAILVGEMAEFLWSAATTISRYLPQSLLFIGPWGYVLVMILSLSLMLGGCFLAGMLAERGVAKRFNQVVEKYLLLVFPRYAIIKEQITGNIGNDILKNQLIPSLIELPGHTRLGFEVERKSFPSNEHQQTNFATVYLPGSPDVWSGQVIVVASHQVHSLTAPFSESIGAMEQLGRGSLGLIDQSDLSRILTKR